MPVSEAPHLPNSGGRDHVLVIDDDPLFRCLLVTILRRDFTLSVASDGAEGFYLALEKTPTLVTIDILMPGWDGLRTLQAFRAHPLLQSIPAILLTSDASRETVMAAIHAGADDYIIKTSFNREILLEKVRLLLGRKGRRPAADPVAEAPAAAALSPAIADRSSELENVSTALDEETRLQAVLDGWE